MNRAMAKIDVFSPSELERAKAELIEHRLGILPMDVNTSGYFYDWDEFVNALENRENLDHKTKH